MLLFAENYEEHVTTQIQISHQLGKPNQHPPLTLNRTFPFFHSPHPLLFPKKLGTFGSDPFLFLALQILDDRDFISVRDINHKRVHLGTFEHLKGAMITRTLYGMTARLNLSMGITARPGFHADATLSIMTFDEARQQSPDLSRQDATSIDSDYTLSIDEAAMLYEHAGHPRTPRSIQRYCAKGHLDCRRIETAIGEKYLITSASVAKHIAYIEEVRPTATGLDVSRQVATTVALKERIDDERQEATTSRDKSRHDATELDIFEHPYVKRLEAEVDEFKGKYEKQVRRTEDVLDQANQRLIELQQASAIAQSETLAKYMLEARGVPTTPIEKKDERE